MSPEFAEFLSGRLGIVSPEFLSPEFPVAQFAMDPSKLVMKWKDRDRIAEHIIETSMTRAAKGDAFRT